MEKKSLYELCKKELKNRRENVKYFNMDFFNHFCEYKRLSFLSNNDNSYDLKRGEYIKQFIFTSDFYNKNSCAYCEFLSIAFMYERLFEMMLQ